MDRSDRTRQMRMLMTLRIVTVTTLLVCAFGIELLLRPAEGEGLRPLFLLAATAYGMVIAYGLLDRWMQGTAAMLTLQLLGDAAIITLFVQITGGLASPMTFLYLLPIAVGSMLLYRRGGLTIAGAAWLCYAAMIALGNSWTPLGTLAPIPGEPDPGRVVYLLTSHLVAMLLLAVLASYLSERVRAQGDELADRQQAVVRLKALNENIIESINSGLITTDLGGRVNFINRGGSEITGHGQDGLEGRDIGEFFGLGDDALTEIRRRLLAHRRYRFERDFVTPSGEEIFLGIAASNLHDKAGRPLGYIFIFQDLTEIQALEQEVRLKERMAALGEMAAGMAHELRNPLASISGAVQYLKGSIAPDGETLDLMDIVLRESQRLDGAIRDFLTFARPGKFSPEPVDLVKLLDEHVKLLRKSFDLRSGHRIETRFDEPVIRIAVDANRMKQIFWNLATNAIKAMPDGGTLTIAARALPDEGHVEILFADQGRGMSAKERNDYFQPFNSSFREGTGLGAAIVYRLIEEHDGRIQLESEEGKGTSVRIRLPLRAADDGAEPPYAEPPLRAAGGDR